jgi:phage-related protein
MAEKEGKESVGKIWLDLEIRDAIDSQIGNIAKKAGANLSKAFSSVGEEIDSAISSAGKKAEQAAEASMDRAKEFVSQTDEEIRSVIEESVKKQKQAIEADQGDFRNFGEAVTLKKDWREHGMGYNELKQADAAAKVSAKIQEARQNAVDFAAAVGQAKSPLDLLDLKLSTINDRLEQAKQRLSEATQQNAADPNEKTASSVTQAQERLVSLQAQAIKTEEAISKAMEKVKSKASSAFTGVKNIAKKAFSGIGSFAASAMGRAKTAISSGVQKITGGLKKFTHSISNAFKRVMFFGTIYAAFRAFKDVIGKSIMANEEFANSVKAIKGNLMVALTPAINAAMPLLNSLASVFVSVSRHVAEISAGLFGQTYRQALAATQQMHSVSKESKKAKGALSGIDSFTVLQTKDESGDGAEDSAAALAALGKVKYASLEGALEKITDKLAGMAGKVGGFVSSVLEKIAAGLPKFVDAGARIITSFLSGFNRNFPSIIKSAVKIITALMDGLKKILPELGPFITNVITLIISSALTYIPELIACGAELLANVLTGLAEKIPEILPLMDKAIDTIINAVTTNLPTILIAGFSILQSLLNGILNNLNKLIPAIKQIILDMVSIIIANLPAILDAGIDILLTLIEGIIDMLPELITAAIQIILILVRALTEPKTLKRLVLAAIELVIAIVDGLAAAAPEIRAATNDLIANLWETIKSIDWWQVGFDIIKSIINGFTSMSLIGALSDQNRVSVNTGGKRGSSASLGVAIPALAAGGLVKAPTLAMIGESGREAVLPLDHNNKWIDELANRVSSNSGGGDIYITENIKLDDGTLVDTYTRRISKRGEVKVAKTP